MTTPTICARCGRGPFVVSSGGKLLALMQLAHAARRRGLLKHAGHHLHVTCERAIRSQLAKIEKRRNR